ncbi:MAG: hypothetical protein ACTSPD_13045 [Promethearchaeota archaeon]
MDKNFLENLKNSFTFNDFKGIYLNLIKIFKNFEEIKLNREFILQILKILNLNKEKLIFKEKEQVVEQCISRICEETNLFKKPKYIIEEKDFFFKKQITDLISREIFKLICLLNFNEYKIEIVTFLKFLYSQISINVKNHIIFLHKLCKKKKISAQHLKSLLNSIFDKDPKTTLIEVIKLLKNKNYNRDENLIHINFKIYELLFDYSRIFPELYFEKIDFFLRELVNNLELKNESSVLIAQIIRNIVEDCSRMFNAKFFDLILFFKEILLYNNKKINNLIEISIKVIYKANLNAIFEYFKKFLKEDFTILLNQMEPENRIFNDIIFEFFIDYLNYSKIFYFNGKITKELLENYLKIFEFFYNSGFMNEFFLFSAISQLKLKKIEVFSLSRTLNRKDELLNKEKLKEIYKIIIKELKEDIKIIFED